MRTISFPILISVLSAMVAVFFLISLAVGPSDIAIKDAVIALLTAEASPTRLIMVEIRLPRALLAALIGGGLGLAGAAIQGLLRNPLAEPGLLGVSSTAGLGAVIALQTGLAAAYLFALPLMALLGAAIGVGLIFFLAGTNGSSLVIILAGIAISSLATALTALALNLSPNPYAASEIIFWMMGSLANRSLNQFWLALPFIIVGAILIIRTGRGLDALSLGEDVASSMGFGLGQMRTSLIIAVALIVGPATAVAGVIGFVGLVVPHVLRPLVGGRPSPLLLASMFGGAALLLAADVLVRLILPQGDLKLGVVTALIGAPLFLHLIYKTRKAML